MASSRSAQPPGEPGVRRPVGVQDAGERLDAVHQARARPGEGGVGVDRPDRDAGRQHPAASSSRPAGPSPRSRSRRARRRRRRGRRPRRRPRSCGTDRSPRRPSTVAAGAAAPSRAPSARARTAGRSTPAPAPAAGAARPPARPRRPAAPAGRRPGRRPRPRDRSPRRACTTEASTSLQVVRVDGEHLGAAAEVGQRVVDDRDVDGAHGAQVLGDHEVGVQVGERAAVEVVEVLAGGASGRAPPRRSRPGRGPRAARWWTRSARAGLRRVVALEGHPDDVVARAEREEDLGGRRQQRHDVHAQDPTTEAAGCHPGTGRLSVMVRDRVVAVDYGHEPAPAGGLQRRRAGHRGDPAGAGPAGARGPRAPARGAAAGAVAVLPHLRRQLRGASASCGSTTTRCSASSRSIDRRLMFLNLALLLVVSVLPFPTAVAADGLRRGGRDAQVALFTYSAAMFLGGDRLHLAVAPHRADPRPPADAPVRRRAAGRGPPVRAGPAGVRRPVRHGVHLTAADAGRPLRRRGLLRLRAAARSIPPWGWRRSPASPEPRC